MKKLFVILIASLLICTSSFAEFMVSPTLGYSNRSANVKIKDMSNVSAKVSFNSMALGVDFGYLMNSGLSFYLNNNVSFLSSGKTTVSALGVSVTEQVTKTKGAFYDGQLLAGWTFRDLVPNLRISILGGLGFGYGAITPTQGKYNGEKVDVPKEVQDSFKVSIFNIGLAIHFHAQYYFTDLVGIGLSLTETLGYGKFETKNMDMLPKDQFKGGFGNVFMLRLGPTFKF